MVNIQLNGNSACFDKPMSILEAARSLNIEIPSLCYLKDLNDIASCRMCVVEIEGQARLVAACNALIEDNMVIYTHSPRCEASRKATLKLINSHHLRNCDECHRDGICKLQDYFKLYNIDQEDSGQKLLHGKKAAWPENSIIQKDHNKCILCGRCVSACKHIQGTRVWNYIGSGSKAQVGINNNQSMLEAHCVSCGQCITHCVDGALSERDDLARLKAALADPELFTVIQIAPAVRTAFAQNLGIRDGSLTVEHLSAAAKRLGFDKVFDTVFAADLTIMEEATELVNCLNSNIGGRSTMFTSCCPAWVTYMRNEHPDKVEQLSSAKSPMMMLAAVIKDYFAKKQGIDPEKIFSVALMPCTAKKQEIKLPGSSFDGVHPDMDLSITTREFMSLIAESDIDILKIDKEPLDNPLGEGTGAGVIFGTTGGVMEAALRSAAYFMTGTNPSPDAFSFSEHPLGWKESSFNVEGITLSCAYVSGLVNAQSLMDALEDGRVHYDFVEVMACPGGCSGGGGQPIDASDAERALERGAILRSIDKTQSKLRHSHENPLIKELYATWLEVPGSHLAHKRLHIDHQMVVNTYKGEL